MRRFRSILVYPTGLHGSDPSIETATDLARRTGASITIVSVLSPDSPLHEAWRPRRQARLDALTSQLTLQRISATSALLTARSPASALVDYVRKRRIDLVVKTARVGDGREARAFSAIAKELMRTCPCPVWTVRGPGDETRPVILAAIAPFHHDSESERLDRDVLEVAMQLADLRDVELHVASAWTPIAGGYATRDEYEAYANAGKTGALRNLRAFLAPHPITSANIHLRDGRAADVVSAVALELDAELVVVGSAGRTGLRRWILGNTVDDVLDTSAAAVLGVPDKADRAATG